MVRVGDHQPIITFLSLFVDWFTCRSSSSCCSLITIDQPEQCKNVMLYDHPLSKI
ncbi:hypothetical protein DFA_02912 [Cavenderia fasciculata]|uniref:Uncharacterized protein n=1 Tax=Cavenderia fasciculata TaxID=261658 RepID=F4PIT9_CACFS|nr:uncharacterized protein DFA_02912 [Cavenderia fasciculata]EGG24668.1 hypothetical protein DFA_02912 [Cavenderia fasciculata]|eukprot:XP_004362519.1 hypothetical protein DFA_02912 [Cavenderia fasciculata]